MRCMLGGELAGPADVGCGNEASSVQRIRILLAFRDEHNATRCHLRANGRKVVGHLADAPDPIHPPTFALWALLVKVLRVGAHGPKKWGPALVVVDVVRHDDAMA